MEERRRVNAEFQDRVEDRLSQIEDKINNINIHYEKVKVYLETDKSMFNKLLADHDREIKYFKELIEGKDDKNIGIKRQIDRIEQRGALVWALFVGAIVLILKEFWQFIIRK